MEIAIVIISIVCVVAYLNTRKEKMDKAKAVDSPLPVIDPEELFKAMGVEVKDRYESEDKSVTHYWVAYQGGHFRMTFQKESRWIDVAYFNFHECKDEHMVMAMTVANVINDHYKGWTCYVDTNENENKETATFANLTYGFMQHGTLEQTKAHLQNMMGAAFHIAREYVAQLDEKIKNRDEMNEEFLNNKVFKNQIARVLWLNNLNHLPERQEEEKPDKSVFSIQHLVNVFEETDFGCLQDMRIICSETVNKETDLAEIEAFDLREYIRKRPDAREIQSLTLIYGFEHQDLLVNLTKAEGSSENTLFFTMNIICSGGEVSSDVVAHKRTMMEVRLADDDQEYWEAKYMVDEAMDKAKEGRMNELTNEQRLVVAYTDPSIQMELYWGKKYYNHQCYYQSLFHFKKVLNAFKQNMGQLSEETMNFYTEICFYVGFIYNDMKMYDRAFYYLYIAQSANRIDGVMEFANCICNMKDMGAKNYIHRHAEELSKVMEKDEEEAERLMPLYNFLRRRFAYVLIDHHELDDAERMLNEMVTNGQDVEFAKGELEYIHQLKIKERLDKVKEQREKRLNKGDE